MSETAEALESMVWQFAFKTTKNDRPALCTGGLSALEEAFAVLGWNDPHVCPAFDEAGCDKEGCNEWATCGQPTPDGYKHFCGRHMDEYRLLANSAKQPC